MPSSVQEIISDQDFKSASPEVQKQVLSHVDPDFGKLSPEEFTKFIQKASTRSMSFEEAKSKQPDFTNPANRLMKPEEDQLRQGPGTMERIASGLRTGAREALPLIGMAGGEMIDPLGGGILGYAGGVEGKKLLNRMTADKSLMTPPLPPLKDQIVSALKSTGESLKEGAETVLGGEVLGKLKSVLGPFSTYRKGSEILNETASREAQNFMSKYKPKTSAFQLFEKATSEVQTRIPMSQTKDYTEKLLKDISVTSPEAQASMSKAVKWAEGLQEHIAKYGGALNPYQLNEELKPLGKMIGSVEYGPVRGELKQIYRNMVEDLDNASSEYNANRTLKMARDTFKRDATIQDVSDSITKWTKSRRGDEAISFNANKVLDEIKKDKFFTQAFTTEEQREIKDLLKKLNNVPILKPPEGVRYGSGPTLQKLGPVLGYGGGAGITAHYLGASASQSAELGIAIAGAIKTTDYAIQTGRFISQALGMKEGRNLLTKLLKEGKGTLSQKSIITLGQWAARNDQAKDNPKEAIKAKESGGLLSLPAFSLSEK